MVSVNKVIAFMAISLCLLSSCSKDPVAEDVYKMNKPAQEKLNYGLVVTLKGAMQGKEYFLVARQASMFDGKGTLSGFAPDDVLFKTPFKNNVAAVPDLIGYKDRLLFFDVLEKRDEQWFLVSNSGSELLYQPVFGEQQKTIDLSLAPSPFVKHTFISVSLPVAYTNKDVYLVPMETSAQFERAIVAGHGVSSDLYATKLENKGETVTNYVVTPKDNKEYRIYVVRPNSELPFVYRPLTLEKGVFTASAVITEERKKQINVSITRGGERFDRAEVYLIDYARWEEVDDHITKMHGNPEAGTFVAKKVATNGQVTFELYQTEGERHLVVLVPKWNTDYYDSYEMREITIRSGVQSYNVDVSAAFTPITGGQQSAVSKEVTFNITVNKPDGLTLNPWASYVYVVKDAANLAMVWSAITEGGDVSDMAYISDAGVADGDRVQIKGLVDTGKEIVILVPAYKGFFTPVPLITKVNGSSIQGDAIDVIVDKQGKIQ